MVEFTEITTLISGIAKWVILGLLLFGAYRILTDKFKVTSMKYKK